MMRFALCLLLLFGGLLSADQTLSLDFKKAKTLQLGKKTVQIPAGTDEYLAVGKTGLSLPAETLVGAKGTILFQLRLQEPAEGKMIPRYLLTLRCKSRLTAGLYVIPGSRKLRFSFGDRASQLYHAVKEDYQYGRSYQVGLAWDGARVRFFLDGKLVGDYKQPIAMERVGMLHLGPYRDGWMVTKTWGNDVFFKNVRTYNHMLTPAEVAAAQGVVLQSAAKAVPPVLTVPVNREAAPSINGELAEKFWQYGASLPALTSLLHPLKSLQAPAGRFVLSCDEKNFYLGFSYRIPAGNPIAAGNLRRKDAEPEVWGTESFEFYLLLGGNLYRFAGNAAGGYTEAKNGGNEWNGSWSYSSQVRMKIDSSSVWEGEAAIPWKTLGLQGVPSGQLKFNFCRSWCLSDYSEATSLIGGKGYARTADFVPLQFRADAPVVQVLEQNDPSRGVFQQKVQLAASSDQEVLYRVSLLTQNGTSRPLTVGEKKIRLQKGVPQTAELQGRITSSAYDALCYELLGKNQPVARILVPFKLNEVYLDVRPRFIAGFLEVEIQKAMLQAKFGAGCSPVLILKNPSGREIFRQKAGGVKMKIAFDRKNPAGDYTAEIADRNGRRLSSQIFHFPGIGKWAEMQFDRTVILPPFTPLKTRGTEYSMWGRTYVYGSSLLPERISSQNAEMLLGPGEILANGKNVGIGRNQTVSAADWRAEFKGSADSSECSLQSDSWVEYDGVSYSRFTMQARKNLKDIRMRFVLPEKIAKYLHASKDGTWGTKLTRPVTEGSYVFGFYPMIWLGMEDKGVCFFSETRKGWTVPERLNCRLLKQNGRVVLEYAMADQLKAGEKFSFELGMVATPVKPLPKDYPYNMLGDAHCVRMRRPGCAPVNSVFVASAPYPNEISSYFCDLPSEKASPANKAIEGLLQRRNAAGNRMIVYMDARYLSDEYPEVAAFRDEWKASPEHPLNYTRDGRKFLLFDCCPESGASAFFHMRLKRFFQRFRADGIYYDFGIFGICNNALHGCSEHYPILAMREFYRRTALVQYQAGNREPLIALHNTDSVQVPAVTFATHFFNGEHIRQHSSTIMHNGKDIQDTYGIEMFASELGSLPFGITNSVYQANDVLLPQFGGGKEDPALYKFRITQAFLAGVLPHNTMLAQSRCHYGILEKVIRSYENFGISDARFIGYWEAPAKVSGAEHIYVSVYRKPWEKKALAVISHIGKEHRNQTFRIAFDQEKLGFVPNKALDLLTAPDPDYDRLYEIRKKNGVPDYRAPLKLGDFGSQVTGIRNGILSMSLKYHTFALVELE